MPDVTTRRLIILGSTGSIGRQTIEVVQHLNRLCALGQFPVRYEIVGLAGGKNADALLAQAAALDVRSVALAAGAAPGGLSGLRGAAVLHGPDAAERLVRETQADLVLGAVVGSAGLGATLAAVELGLDVALANKETLVAAGSIVVEACRRSGARLLPVDSEHSAVWQCLIGHTTLGQPVPPCALPPDVSKVILTASGGALRNKSREQVYNASPQDALAHPNWSMGAKVTIDSASLTNKALEVIEAHWLYGLDASRIGVLVHPQSIVHALVEFVDGALVAQLGVPDMKTPIQLALSFPHRCAAPAARLDWLGLSRLDFSAPDLDRFPALALGFRVIEEGGTSGAVFNGANEAAVEAFLERKIPFGRIPELSAGAMDEIGVSPVRDLNDVYEADAQARRYVARSLGPQTRPAPRGAPAR